MSNALKISSRTIEDVAFAKPEKLIVLLCVSKTNLKKFSFLEGSQRANQDCKAESFVQVQEYLSQSKAFKISYDFPFFVKSTPAQAEGGLSLLLSTDKVKFGCELSHLSVFHFPSDCVMLSYEYTISQMSILKQDEPSALYSDLEAELFRQSEEHLKKTRAAESHLGVETILNWRYAYSVYYGSPDKGHFPFDRNQGDIESFLNIEPTIKKEYVRSNIFTWEYAYLHLTEANSAKEMDVLSLVSYQCFLYFQLEQMQKETTALVHEIQESFLHRRKKEMDRLIDRSVLLRLEVNKLSDSFVVDRVTYARDYQAILRQLEISFESDRKMKLLQSASKEMVSLVKHVNDIIEVRTSGMIQKVLVALAFYALPGAITDSATFIGILPESQAPEFRGMLFAGLLVALVGLPYISIRLRNRIIGE